MSSLTVVIALPAAGVLAASPLSPAFYIGGGLLVVALILVAETGLLLGFFLPGDTLLLLAGSYTVDTRAERVLHRFGEGRATVAARFIPVVRTFMNPALGATTMAVRDFTVWNAVGALLWVPPVLLLGRLVGAAFPLDVVVVISLLLPLVELVRRRVRT